MNLTASDLYDRYVAPSATYAEIARLPHTDAVIGIMELDDTLDAMSAHVIATLIIDYAKSAEEERTA